jgi:hypothetical protein
VGGWTETRPVSLGLLPSGPDPVGEWYVQRQPPSLYLDHVRDFRKLREQWLRIRLSLFLRANRCRHVLKNEECRTNRQHDENERGSHEKRETEDDDIDDCLNQAVRTYSQAKSVFKPEPVSTNAKVSVTAKKSVGCSIR